MEKDEQIRQRVSMRVRVSRGGRHVFYACRLFVASEEEGAVTTHLRLGARNATKP
jgi:hypothetical protein